MPAQTSMLHIRVDDHLKAQAADALAGVGLIRGSSSGLVR